MDAIVAVYSDWGIGDGGTQPIVLKADRVHFREMTNGAAVIVGRKTLEDFPGGKPLKNRVNIVITRQNLDIDGAIVVNSTEQALDLAKQYDRCFVIGGASVFMQFFPYLDRIFITKLDCCPESSSFFPNLDENPEWTCTDKGPVLEESGTRYCFCTYERITREKEH